MSKDIVQRLRTLPPEMPDPGDRFDRVRARVLRRRRLAIASAAAVTVVAAIGVPVGLALPGGGSDRPAGPATPAPDKVAPDKVLSCPPTFGGRQRWVPQRPTGVDGRSRLVPLQPPQRALVCTSGGESIFASRRAGGSPGRIPPGGRVLSSGLDRLAEDLSRLPRKLPGQGPTCSGGAPPTEYLIGLTYPDGTVWVWTADVPNCSEISNGEFTSGVNMGRQVAASYAAGAWVPDPFGVWDRDPEDPCQAQRSGRLGQETVIVPPGSANVRVCKRTHRSTGDIYQTRTATGGYRKLVDALNAPPTQTSTSSCQVLSGRVESISVSYELVFRYVFGPPVLVRVQPGCAPAIDNGSLQAADASSVLPEIIRLLGAGS
jgi:hypothetical protein